MRRAQLVDAKFGGDNGASVAGPANLTQLPPALAPRSASSRCRQSPSTPGATWNTTLTAAWRVAKAMASSSTAAVNGSAMPSPIARLQNPPSGRRP